MDNERGEALRHILNTKRHKEGFKPQEENIVLKISGKTVSTIGNFSVLSGLPKAGKSSFLSAIIASGLIRAPIFDIELNNRHTAPQIALFDTESSEYDFYRSLDRVKNIANINKLPTTFDAYRLRDCNHKEILELVEYYIAGTGAQIIIIDGLLDLLLNFNDEVESRILINWLKKLTDVYNCFVLGIIHTGKGNGLTLGHLGSMIERYAQSTLLVQKDDERQSMELSAKYMRSDAHFEPIQITSFNGNFSQLPYFKTPKK